MPVKSAGILFFKEEAGEYKFLLVHPGGPFWARKDLGAWSIPKGELNENEDPLPAAKREVKEELGVVVEGDMIALQPVKQKSGKIVMAWAVKMDVDVSAIKSNFFEIEWPKGSGKMKAFPEIDKAAWFNLEGCELHMLPGQLPLVKQLMDLLVG